MRAKKNPQKNIDKRTLLLRLIGFNFTLLMVLLAFQYTTYERQHFELEAEIQVDEEEEMADVTQQQEIPPPPQPPDIEIIEDDEEIEEDQPDIETEWDDDIEDYDFEEEAEEVEDDEIFTVVEDDPQFPGGNEELHRYLSEEIEYPRVAREAGLEGRVFVSFVVEPDGSITNVEVREGVSEELNEEAKRVVRSMPKWEPGKQRDQAVRVSVNLPINFRLGR